MGLSIGIVGLPNTGKSTLFNALLKQAQAEVSNYPFCTIEPNVGIVEVPDDRLSLLASRLSLSKIIPASIKFVDIAGLIKNAAKGEGLGNQFLAHIRECDVIVEVVRFFEDQSVAGVVDPESDIETIKTELILKDLETIDKYLEKFQKEIKSADKNLEIELKIIERLKENLGKEKLAREVGLSDFPKEIVLKVLSELQLLTNKSIIYVVNISESQIGQQFKIKEYNLIPICAKTEAELSEFKDDEAVEYLKSLGLEESGISKLIKEAYRTLGLITFYTLKLESKQIQAWPIKNGGKAIEAAEIIHTDFAKKFIIAEVVNFKDLIKAGSWQEAHNKGLVRTEGKDYLICDGDVVHFKVGS